LLTGILLGVSERVRDYVEPTLRGLFAVPSIGWIPILILIFGVDETLKILIIAKAVFVPLVINTAQGIRNVPIAYREAAQVMKLRAVTRLFKLTIPASLPSIFSGVRLGLSHAFIALVVVEMLAATEGIGYMMVWGRKLFQIDTVIVGMLIVGVLGYALDKVLRSIETRLSTWTPPHGR
jgi:sulfonate transport system permease protein